MAIWDRKKRAAKEGAGLGRSVSLGTGATDALGREDGASPSLEPEIFVVNDPLPQFRAMDDAVSEEEARKVSEEILSVDTAKNARQVKGKKGKGKKELSPEERQQEEAELSRRLSNRVLIESLPGMTREDAIATARHWALNHFENPTNCYYFVQEVRGAWLIEVQEGVGRSYLPSIIELAQRNPGRLIVVPMVRRKLTVHYSPRTDSFEAQVLSEGVEPPAIAGEAPIEATRGSAMTPVMKQYQQWLLTGLITAGIGGVTLLAALTFYAFDPKSKVPPEWRTTDVAQLPVLQWPRLQPEATDSYVVRLEFGGNQWRVVRQSTGAQVEVNNVGGTGAGGEIVGGEVSAPTSPDMMGAGRGMAPAAPQGFPPQGFPPQGFPPNPQPVPSAQFPAQPGNPAQ